ncbi:MAG: hypothetical protein FWF57_09975 [Defluviitaleaceae bacterium]|nr:hypothetical protein [Defluviitaleaceae bacterium]
MVSSVECIYQNSLKENCLVKSHLYMLNPQDSKENLTPIVYVDIQKPKKYAIELFRNIKELEIVDRDYR